MSKHTMGWNYFELASLIIEQKKILCKYFHFEILINPGGAGYKWIWSPVKEGRCVFVDKGTEQVGG